MTTPLTRYSFGHHGSDVGMYPPPEINGDAIALHPADTQWVKSSDCAKVEARLERAERVCRAEEALNSLIESDAKDYEWTYAENEHREALAAWKAQQS